MTPNLVGRSTSVALLDRSHRPGVLEMLDAREARVIERPRLVHQEPGRAIRIGIERLVGGQVRNGNDVLALPVPARALDLVVAVSVDDEVRLVPEVPVLARAT